eukprot:9893677-Heterocapsa_arctica.AAC.1
MAYAMLDAKLREGTWPVGRLTESRPPEPGAESTRNRRRARTTPTEGRSHPQPSAAGRPRRLQPLSRTT